MCRRIAVLACLSLASLTHGVVDVDVFANWPSYPASLLFETAEYLSEEDRTLKLFWRYVDVISAAGVNMSDADAATHLAFETASGLLPSPLAFRMLKLAVASRSYSPRVEMHRSLASATGGQAACPAGTAAWVVVVGGPASSGRTRTSRLLCSSEDVAGLLTMVENNGDWESVSGASVAIPDAALALQDWDYQHPASSPALAVAAAQSGAPTAFLYGPLGHPQTAALHAQLTRAAGAGHLRYILRHNPLALAPLGGSDAQTGGVTWLSGYGVGWDIKSTEYKFMDDRQRGDGAADIDPGLLQALASLGAADTTLPPQGFVALQPQPPARVGPAPAAVAPNGGPFNASRIAERFGAEVAAALEAAAASVSSVALDPSLPWLGEAANIPPVPVAAGGSASDNHMAAAAPAAGGLRPWQLGRLGLQAATYILDGASPECTSLCDPLARLTAVTGNLPSLAPYLSTLPVPAELVQEAATLRGALGLGDGASASLAGLEVNGLHVSPSAPTFNLFSLLDTLRQEAGVAQQAGALPLSPADRRRVADVAVAGTEAAGLAAAAALAADGAGAAPAGAGEGGDASAGAGSPARSVRVDVLVGEGDIMAAPPTFAAAAAAPTDGSSDGDSSSPLRPFAHPHPIVHWLVDLESPSLTAADPSYRRWPASLQALLQPSWQLHAVRRNLYHSLLAGDLASPQGLRALATLQQFLSMRLPITWGLLPVPGSVAGTPPAASAGAAGEAAAAAEAALLRDSLAAFAARDSAAAGASAGSSTKGGKASASALPRICVVGEGAPADEEEEEDDEEGEEGSVPASPCAVAFDLAAPLTGLQLSLLHSAALTRHGPEAAVSLISGIGGAWRAAASGVQQAAAEAAAAALPADVSGEARQAAMQSAASRAVEDMTLPLQAAVDAYAAAAAAASGAWSSGAGAAEAVDVLTDKRGLGRRTVLGAVRWLQARGLTPSAGGPNPLPCIVVNGRVKAGSLDLQGDVMPLISEEMQALQRAVASNAIDDGVAPSVYHALLGRASVLAGGSRRKGGSSGRKEGKGGAGNLKLPGVGLVVPRYHPSVFSGEEGHRYLPLSAPALAPLLTRTRYLHPPGTADDVKPVSLTLLGDLGQPAMLRALAGLAQWLTVKPAPASSSSSTAAGGEGSSDAYASSSPLSSSLAASLPAHVLSSVARSLRLAAVHVPPIPLSAAAADSDAAVASVGGQPLSLGLLVQAGWSLIAGAAPAALTVRSEEQGPLAYALAASVAEAAEAAAAAAGGAAPSALQVLPAVRAALLAGYGGGSASRKRAAERLAAALETVAAAGAGAAGASIGTLAGLAASLAATGSLAQEALLASVPRAAAVQTAAGGAVSASLAALAANGRVYALQQAQPSSAAAAALSSGPAAPSQLSGDGLALWQHLHAAGTTAGAARAGRRGGEGEDEEAGLGHTLPLQLAPGDVAAVVTHERTTRGAGLAALLSTVDFSAAAARAEAAAEGEGADGAGASSPAATGLRVPSSDDLTADWISAVVMAASSAVGSATALGASVGPGTGSGGRSGSGGGRSILPAVPALQQVARATVFTSHTAGDSSSGGSGAASDGSGLSVTAVLDPLTEEAARIAPLLQLLRDRLGASVRVFLLPSAEGYSELPLRSYYRLVMPADPQPAGGDGASGSPLSWKHPRALFRWLPPAAVLTAKLLVPEPWNVQTASAAADLDNLRLSDAGPALSASASFVLRDLMVAGQCLDVASRAFPNGLQLTLRQATSAAAAAAGSASSYYSDTLVMQNLGYWQLKAAPGLWSLQLAEGRASDLFRILNPSASASAAAAAASGSGEAEDPSERYLAPLLRQQGVADAAAGAAASASLFNWKLYSKLLARHRAGGVQEEEEGHGATPVGSAAQLLVSVRDFTGPITQLAVLKRRGKEHVSLLDSIGSVAAATGGDGAAEGAGAAAKAGGSGGGGMWGAMKRTLFGAAAPEPDAEGIGAGEGGAPAANDTAALTAGGIGAGGAPIPSHIGGKPVVHVFSLASGHLYERFLKIMMLSATKRSPSAHLHFWLVENFLSPQFKAAAAALASAYGFSVGYVTYKWPNWLRQQSEKQRVIWGYKILFLDVLFPLYVPRVIYVDSDQVVRSDLRELWELDLQGKPYAYTPFCTSREETLGYQFWRQGYWKDHLRGKPYHISALYVVDLQAFRRQAVGDTLRSIYDNLSRDAGSLSNLDQDLPNYAQAQIPIHSLDQRWLWCESWCSDGSKAEAKTIDLCNNPRFKEPKLDMARRVRAGGAGADGREGRGGKASGCCWPLWLQRRDCGLARFPSTTSLRASATLSITSHPSRCCPLPLHLLISRPLAGDQRPPLPRVVGRAGCGGGGGRGRVAARQQQHRTRRRDCAGASRRQHQRLSGAPHLAAAMRHPLRLSAPSSSAHSQPYARGGARPSDAAADLRERLDGIQASRVFERLSRPWPHPQEVPRPRSIEVGARIPYLYAGAHVHGGAVFEFESALCHGRRHPTRALTFASFGSSARSPSVVQHSKQPDHDSTAQHNATPP